MTDLEIRGLIFDCDGTLVDTMPLHWRAWNSVCDRHDIVFPEERFYALGGVPSVKILRMLKEEQGLDFDPARRDPRERGGLHPADARGQAH
ncbi:MAG: HAD family hydrolase [Limisphaerales bacterium]